jgi:hypothetical protein
LDFSGFKISYARMILRKNNFVAEKFPGSRDALMTGTTDFYIVFQNNEAGKFSRSEKIFLQIFARENFFRKFLPFRTLKPGKFPVAGL